MNQDPKTPSTCIHELGRWVVSLPKNVYSYEVHTFVAVAMDQTADGTVMPGIVRTRISGLPFQDDYQIFEALCHDRAQRCVDQQLLVNGQPITPERYLSLWREAIESADPVSTLTDPCGPRLIAVLEGPLAALKGMAFPWTGAPFANFDEFEARHKKRMIMFAEERFRLELDLATPEGARDALIGETFLRHLKDESAARACLELRGQLPLIAHQASLLDALEVSHVLSA